MSLHQFYYEVQCRAKEKGERYGQAMFNHLSIIRSDLSERVRGTDKDPFYMDYDNIYWTTFVSFFDFIEANW